MNWDFTGLSQDSFSMWISYLTLTCCYLMQCVALCGKTDFFNHSFLNRTVVKVFYHAHSMWEENRLVMKEVKWSAVIRINYSVQLAVMADGFGWLDDRLKFYLGARTWGWLKMGAEPWGASEQQHWLRPNKNGLGRIMFDWLGCNYLHFFNSLFSFKRKGGGYLCLFFFLKSE